MKRLIQTGMISWLGVLYLAGVANNVFAHPVLDYSKVGIYAWSGSNSDVAYLKIFNAGSSGVVPGKMSVAIIYPVSSTLSQSISNLNSILSTMDLSNISVLVLGEENYQRFDILDGLYDYIKANYPEAPPVYQWYTPMQSQPKVSVKADGYVMDSYGQYKDTFRKWLMRHLLTGKPVINCIWATPAGGGFGGWDEMQNSSQDQVDVCKEFNVPMFFFCVDWSVGGGSVSSWWSSSNPEISVWRDWYLSVREEANATDISGLPMASANYNEGDDLEISGDASHTYNYSEEFSTENFLDRAEVNGFLNLRWDYTNGQLVVEPKPDVANVTGQVTLIYEFYTLTAVERIVANISGTIRGAGSRIEVAISKDKINWIGTSTYSGTVGMTHTFEVQADSGDVSFGRFYVRIKGLVPYSGDAWVSLDHFDMNCTVPAPAYSEAIALTSDEEGNVLWTDDFETAKFFYNSTVSNPSETYWEPGEYIWTRGIAGYSNRVRLRQKFICDCAIEEIVAQIGTNLANYTNWGSYNLIGISLDGTTVVALDRTIDHTPASNGTYSGSITATLSADRIPAGTQEFYLFYEMHSLSGVALAKTNIIDDLAVKVTTVRGRLKPVLSPDGGTFSSAQRVVVSCDVPGAMIRYTTDASDPTETNGTLVSNGDSVMVDQSLTLKARAWAFGYPASGIASSAFTLYSGPYNRPLRIFSCTGVVVDGDLSEWSAAPWTPLDKTLSGYPHDLAEVYYAARWDRDNDRIYVAVKVRDTGHAFTNNYTSSTLKDAIAVYLHTTGEGSLAYTASQGPAQEYVVGIKGSYPNAVWSVMGAGNSIPASAGFQAAGAVNGQWVYYEMALVPYKWFSFSGLETIVSPLTANQVIGLDVVVESFDGQSYCGRKSENLMAGKSNDYMTFGLHELVTSILGDANDDGSVDVGDLGILAANYGRNLYAEGIPSVDFWRLGDFNSDGKVDVGDLGILAGNYGTNAGGTDFDTDYSKVFGSVADTNSDVEESEIGNTFCISLGFPVIAGFALMCMILVKLE